MWCIKDLIEIKDWKEYIDLKFQPAAEFEFSSQKDSPTLDIKHIRTGTVVSFVWPDENWEKVSDIQYYNRRTAGYSGEFGELEFNPKNKQKVDDYLSAVFDTGWSTKDMYLFGRHYKSVVYDRPKLQGEKFVEWSSSFGCLVIPFFPIFLVAELLIITGALGEIQRHEIEPIRK